MALIGATALALGLVAAVTLADDGSTTAEAPTAPEGPALRVAGRAGLVTVGVAARPRSLELRLIAPNSGDGEGELRAVRLTTPAGVSRVLETRSCGPGCHVAPAVLERGVSGLRVSTSFAGRPGAATLRIASPTPTASALLREAVTATARLSRVTVHERLTSDTNGRFFTNPPARVSGAKLVATYGADAATDVRELPPVGELRRVAYALPAAEMWFELWIRADGIIVRDRVTGPNHLILRRIAPG